MSDEKTIVLYFKPMLYKVLASIGVDFVLVGAGALELQVERPSIVNTLDADLHVWSRSPVEPRQFLVYVESRLKQEFSGSILERNRSFIDYYKKKYRNKDYFKVRQMTQIPNVTVMRVRMFGFDLADIAYEEEDPSDYFVIPAVGSSPKLKILKVNKFVDAQLLVLTPKRNVSFKYYRPDIQRDIINILASADIPGTPHYNTNSTGWLQFKHDTLTYINKLYSPEQYFETLFVPENKIAYNERAIVKPRIDKTIKRIKIVLETYDYDIQTNLLTFKQGGSSCLVIQFQDPFLRVVDKDREYCRLKTAFGGENFNIEYIASLYNTTNLRSYIRGLNLSLLNATRGLDFKTACREFAPNFYQTPEEAACIWSTQSTGITNFMKKVYIHKLCGIKNYPYTQEENKLLYTITNLQQACRSLTTNQDLYVFKGGRNFIFGRNKTSLNFSKGDIIEQQYFNSVSINPFYPGFLNFSNYETGVCAYIIKIPSGNKFLYYGNDDQRTKYPSEFELLLPYGCRFEVADVRENSYIGSQRGRQTIYFRLTLYIIHYIPPNESVFSNLDLKSTPLNMSIVQGQSQVVMHAPNNDVQVPMNPQSLGDSIIKYVTKYIKSIEWKKNTLSIINNVARVGAALKLVCQYIVYSFEVLWNQLMIALSDSLSVADYIRRNPAILGKAIRIGIITAIVSKTLYFASSLVL